MLPRIEAIEATNPWWPVSSASVGPDPCPCCTLKDNKHFDYSCWFMECSKHHARLLLLLSSHYHILEPGCQNAHERHHRLLRVTVVAIAAPKCTSTSSSSSPRASAGSAEGCSTWENESGAPQEQQNTMNPSGTLSAALARFGSAPAEPRASLARYPRFR